jgi:DNA polymerase-3 subunit chi
VTANIVLHDLTGPKRAGRLAKLVESIYRENRRVVVWVADEGRLHILDEYLWTFEQLSFLPHAVWAENVTEFDEPVALVSVPKNPIDAEVLVVGDDPPPGDWIASFGEVHDLVPPGDEGDERRAFWRSWKSEHEPAGGDE